MTPKEQRDLAEKTLEETGKNLYKDDFINLRESYIGLNRALAVAHGYDKDKSQKYTDNANKIIEQAQRQDRMGKWERDEDTHEKILIPHKNDEKLYDKFRKENRALYAELENEFSSMKTEVAFFRNIKETIKEFKKMPTEKNGSTLLKNFIELEESRAFTKIDKKGDINLESGKEINKERFYSNYKDTAKELNENIEKHLKNQENNKYKEKGRDI